MVNKPGLMKANTDGRPQTKVYLSYSKFILVISTSLPVFLQYFPCVFFKSSVLHQANPGQNKQNSQHNYNGPNRHRFLFMSVLLKLFLDIKKQFGFIKALKILVYLSIVSQDRVLCLIALAWNLYFNLFFYWNGRVHKNASFEGRQPILKQRIGLYHIQKHFIIFVLFECKYLQPRDIEMLFGVLGRQLIEGSSLHRVPKYINRIGVEDQKEILCYNEIIQIAIMIKLSYCLSKGQGTAEFIECRSQAQKPGTVQQNVGSKLYLGPGNLSFLQSTEEKKVSRSVRKYWGYQVQNNKDLSSHQECRLQNLKRSKRYLKFSILSSNLYPLCYLLNPLSKYPQATSKISLLYFEMIVSSLRRNIPQQLQQLQERSQKIEFLCFQLRLQTSYQKRTLNVQFQHSLLVYTFVIA